MPKASDGQYEVVLENRQVTIIFFAIVVLCGVFFGLGYVVGKNTMGYIPPAQASALEAEGKKSAIGPTAAEEARKQEAPAASDLTYQRTLEEKTPPAALQPQPATAPPTATAPVAARPAPPEGAISLQVAALSKKDDAEALLGLLKKKGFPAAMITAPGDRLFRVQVGPFASAKDAEEMKGRLEQEGFKPIIKK